MERSSYFLSGHVYFCLADQHYVFLDLRSDKYLCLGRADTDAIKGLMNGQMNGHHRTDEHSVGIQLGDTTNSDPNAVMRALLQEELLTGDATQGKALRPVLVDTPKVSARQNTDKPQSAISPAHVWNFFAASLAASADLRWGSLERTVHKVEARKLAQVGNATAVDKAVVTDLFGIFRALRPYYIRPYLCMFDSLALLHFLARYNVYPRWVYGVKLEPWGAHCWVQAGDLVVNDLVDNVRDYTPIMSI